MNEVEDLCNRILNRPPPPMRDSAQVLAIAQRAARRPARVTITAGSLAAAALAAVTALVWSPQTASVHPAPAATSTATVDPGPPPVPPRDKARRTGERIAQLLTAALPTGYTGQSAVGADGTYTWEMPAGRYFVQTKLLVSNGYSGGTLLSSVVRDGTAAPSGDLCTPAVAARVDGDEQGATCEVVTIDRVRVRVTTTKAREKTATRFLADGYLTISWKPDAWMVLQTPASRPPTAPPSPFTAQQLAGLAASCAAAISHV